MEGKTEHLIKTILDQIADLHASMRNRCEEIESRIARLRHSQEEHQEDMEDRFRAIEVLIEDLQLSTDTVAHFVTIKK